MAEPVVLDLDEGAQQDRRRKLLDRKAYSVGGAVEAPIFHFRRELAITHGKQFRRQIVIEFVQKNSLV